MNQNNPELCELAEIVYEKPLSGAFNEISFGSDRGNTLWVKFSDRDGINEWIGKFGDGGRGVRRVTKIEEPDKFLVCSGGFANLVNATNRLLINQFCNALVVDVVYDSKLKISLLRTEFGFGLSNQAKKSGRANVLRWTEFVKFEN